MQYCRSNENDWLKKEGNYLFRKIEDIAKDVLLF